MHKLFDLIEQEGIYLEYASLFEKANVHGLYLSDSKTNVIILDGNLDKPENIKLHKCVLAEEIGHHFTSPRTILYQLHGSCSLDRLKLKQIAQDEYKALVWATNFIMPNVEFNRAVSEGCRSVYDLSEWFDVTPWFVYRKLGIIKRKYRGMGIKMRSRDYFKVKLV